MALPIGFFMPLPLPIMIPFMMWQSAAIAVGFGTMFQYSKRKISSMSNEEFNDMSPIDMINDQFDKIQAEIPSSFDKVSSINIAMFDAMNKMLDQAFKYLERHLLGGNYLTGGGGGGGGIEPPLELEPPSSTFIPGEPGQSEVYSVAWLNSLNREQIKALRNDALAGKFTDDSKKLILARYKELFDFDKEASLPPPPIIKPIQQLKPTGVFPPFTKIELPDIHILHINNLNNKVKAKNWLAVTIKLNALYNSAKGIANNRNADPTQKAKGARETLQLGKAIVRYNKWSQANL